MSVSTRVVEGRFGPYGLAGDPLEVPGSARIFRVFGRADVFYKELGEPLVGAREIERIEELVHVGAEFGGADLSSSRGRIAWPRDAVIEEDRVVGVLTPCAGDQFYDDPIGDTLLPRHLTHLRRSETGVPVEVRLRLVRQLAGVLALLEHAELVHGDISAQNVLWTLLPRPSIYLIDCDGMHSVAVEGSEAVTEGWADPRQEGGAISSHDMRSDWFALALAIWRVTTLSQGAPELGREGLLLPAEVPAPFREPLERTFEDVMDPVPRPSPEEWLEALDEVLGSSRARRRIDQLAPKPVQRPPLLPFREPATAPKPDSESVSMAPRRRHGLLKRVLPRAAILACLVVIGASFLDSGPSASQVRAEAAVAKAVRSRLRVRRPEAVCPADSSLHASARYLCRVETAGGAVARVRVVVKRGGVARRRINLFAFRKRAILRDIHAGYRYYQRHGVEWGLKDISCPQTISAKPGTRFRCAAEFTDGAKGMIVGRMRRPLGYYSWREAGTTLRALSDALH